MQSTWEAGKNVESTGKILSTDIWPTLLPRTWSQSTDPKVEVTTINEAVVKLNQTQLIQGKKNEEAVNFAR